MPINIVFTFDPTRQRAPLYNLLKFYIVEKELFKNYQIKHLSMKIWRRPEALKIEYSLYFLSFLGQVAFLGE